jgi:hypothetical protein
LQDFFQILHNVEGEETRENEVEKKKQTLVWLVTNHQAIVMNFCGINCEILQV